MIYHFKQKANTMKKQVLKNAQGRYFTLTNGSHTTTANLDLAVQFETGRAHQRAQAFNRDHNESMAPVDYDTEVLAYYPHVIYQAHGEIDAKMYVRKVHRGEADGQYSKAHAVCVEGLWFVHGRKEAMSV